MSKIFLQTPLYVWFLLLWILVMGIRACRPHTIHWQRLVLTPIFFSLWSSTELFVKPSFTHAGFWFLSLLIGTYFGYLSVRNTPVTFDKKKGLVHLSKSSMPLIAALTIFFIKYFLRVQKTLNFPLPSPLNIGVESIATLFSGILIGRLLGF